jgi:hypothetical protein
MWQYNEDNLELSFVQIDLLHFLVEQDGGGSDFIDPSHPKYFEASKPRFLPACRFLSLRCQMPNAKCQMPNAKCQMPNAKCQIGSEIDR